MTLLETARAYVAKGLSVIPLVKRDKIPDGSVLPGRSWKIYRERRATDAELVTWFESGERNLGIVTGSISGFVVIDLDGQEGIAVGKGAGFESPLKVVTGREGGGLHLYYKHPGGSVGNSVKLMSGVDVRGDGGFVVAPPSIHPSGRRYQWVKTDGPIPVFSQHVFGTGRVHEELRGEILPRGANEKGWIEEALKSLAPGNRDHNITKIVGRLHRDGWAPSDMIALLASHPEIQDHGIDELQRIVRSISAKPRGVESDSLPEQSLSAFMADETKVSWIVPGMIGKETLGFVAGLPETNKTWLMMDLALEASRGGLWLNKFPTVKSKVLFIDQERFSGETRRRFKAMLAYKEVGAAQLNGNLTVWCGTTIRIDLEQSFNALQKRLETIRPDLVVVDSFVTFHTKEENNRSDAQVVMERIKRLRQEFGCSFIFIDHENKGVFTAEADEKPSSLRMAGSIGKLAAAELVITVRGKGKNRSGVFITKSTLGNAVEPFVVEVKDVGSSDKIKVEAIGE